MSSLTLAGLLVVLNALFVAAEFALVKVRPTQLEALADQGRPFAGMALAMRKNLDTWLAASQVGITLASLALGWVAEPAFVGLIEPVFQSALPAAWLATGVAHAIAVGLTFGLITFLHIVLGEQVPKTIAIQHAESTVLWLAPPLQVFRWLFLPAIVILDWGTKGSLRLLGFRPQGHGVPEQMSEDELRLLVSSSAESGQMNAARADLVERAFEMLQKTARQILVPRSQMKCLDLELSLEENVALARASGHTWLPVVRGSVDKVEGLLNTKDLFFGLAKGDLKTLAQVQRPVLFVPEHVTLEQLLSEFRRRNKQTAVVVDEHGGTSGLVSLADVVAELLGKVAVDGRNEVVVKSLPGGRLELPGAAQLDDLEHTLEIEFDVDHTEVTTLAGYLMAKLGRVPKPGDVWPLLDYRIEVLQTEGPRVQLVRITPRETAPTPPEKA